MADPLDLDLSPFKPGMFHMGMNLGFGSGSAKPEPAPWRTPLDDEDTDKLTRRALGTGLTGLSYIAGTLDKPGQAVRGVLAGKPHAALNLVPFSDSLGLTDERDKTTGRDLTNMVGLTSKGDQGWGAWGAGMAADLATDPLMYWTGGAHHALTDTGRALSKANMLKGWSREAMLKGFEGTTSGLKAAGHAPEDILHMMDQGMRIATPEMEAAAAKAGQTIVSGQALGGLGGFGLPFANPSQIVGTGPVAQSIARGLDKAGHAIAYGKPGVWWGGLFDASKKGGDALTQEGWQKFGDPVEQALKQDTRGHAADVLQQLDPMIQAGTHAERDITQAARAAAEGVPTTSQFDPALVQQVQPLAAKIGLRNEAMLKQAQAAGAPLEDAGDAYANYVHRQALDVNHRDLQLKQKAGMYPVASGSNMHREDWSRNIPGGTERINDWFKRWAGLVAAETTPAGKKAARDQILQAVRQDMTTDLAASGPMKAPLKKQSITFPEDIAKQIGNANERYRTDQLDFYTPDLARDEIQRNAQHARTMGATKAAIGTIGMAARPFVKNAEMTAIPDLMNRLGLRTYKADAAAGTPMQGALVEMYRALAKQGAGMVDPYLMGKVGKLQGEVARWGLPNKTAESILQQYPKWMAPAEIGGPLKFMDSLTNAFKALAYPMWIPAHVRNAGTATINNMRSGVSLADYAAQKGIMKGTATAQDLARYGFNDIDEARKAMFSSANIFGGHGVVDDVADSAIDTLTGGGPVGRFTPHAPGSDRLGPTGNVLKDSANLIFKEGLMGSLGALGRTAKQIASNPLSPRTWGDAIASNVGIKGVGGVTKDALPAVHAGRIAGTNIEDYYRGAQWLAEVRQGASHSRAADAVNALHFDYDRLTPFEKNVMRRLVPFYTYARKNLPLQVSTAMHAPAWTVAQTKPFIQQDQDDPQNYIPDYMASGVAIPTGPEVDGKRQYINKLGLPAEEAFERMHFWNGLPDIRRTALEYMGQMNPMIKAPMEQLFDTQFHTQRKLSDLHAPRTASMLGSLVNEDNPQLLSQILVNSLATRFITSADKLLDDRKDWGTKAANLFSGVRVSDVNVDRQRAIDARDSLEQILQGKPHLSRYTSFYVKPEQAGNLTPDETELMRLYSGMQKRARAFSKDQRKQQSLIGVEL